MKYARIVAQRTHYSIELMCRVLEASRSDYFAWRTRRVCQRPDTDAQVREDVRTAYREHRRL